ncbi:MAG: stage II sporulation protein M [Clostridia bacterium]|nr:stage II sporulation protein M [Clostridia bacterium]
MKVKGAVNVIKYKVTRFKIYLFFVLVFLTGVLIGSFVSGILPAQHCEDIALPLKQAREQSYGFVFAKSFLGCVKPVVFMWIAGFFGFAVYCNMIAVVYKGGILGIMTGVLLKTYGIGRGIVVSVCGILPQYMVFIPVLMYVCMATFEFSTSKQKPKRKIINYVLHLVIALMGCLFTALTDTYVTSLLLQLCMNGE